MSLDNIILPQTRDYRRNAEQLIGKARLLMKQMGIEDLEHRDYASIRRTASAGGHLPRFNEQTKDYFW